MKLRDIISREIWSMNENVQQMEKHYIKTGVFDENDKQNVLDITGGDVTTKTIADLYNWMLSGGMQDGKRRDYDTNNKRTLQELHQELLNYDKNVFPIKDFDLQNNKIHPIDLYSALGARKYIKSVLKKIPSVYLRNLRDDIRKPRTQEELNYGLKSTIEEISRSLKLIEKLSEEKQEKIFKKIFSSKHENFEQIADQLEKTEILFLSHNDAIEELRDKIEYEAESDEAELLYDDGDIVVVNVKSSDAMKSLGCGSQWCFATEYGTDHWANYADNSHVNIVYNFNEEPDSPLRMVVVLPHGDVYNMYNEHMGYESEDDYEDGWDYLRKIGVEDKVNANVVEESLNEDYPENFNMDEFKSLTSFAARKKYADQHLPKIASGSGRHVYVIDNEKVLKLAANKKGLAQNETETSLSHNYATPDIITKVYDSHPDNLWIESEHAKKISPSRFKQLLGFSVEHLGDWLRNQTSRYSTHIPDDVKEVINESEWANDLLSLVMSFSVESGDLGRISSFGEVNRGGEPQVVVTDYGLTKDVYKTHYDKSEKRGMYENEDSKQDNYLTQKVLDIAKQKGLNIIDDKYIGLYHGTSPAAHKRILKTGKFYPHSWFATDFETAKRFGQQAIRRGEPVVSLVYIDASQLIPSGDYFTIKNDIKEIPYKHGIYEIYGQNDNEGLTDINHDLEREFAQPDLYAGYNGFALPVYSVDELNEENLNEHYIPYSHLALYVIDDFQDTEYILYDPKIVEHIYDADEADKYFHGYISVRENNKYNALEVDTIAAKQGYGPLMYMIAMTVAGKKGLLPTRVTSQISQEAIKVWKEFDSGKGEQYVEAVPIEDGHYGENYDFLDKKYFIKNPIKIDTLLNNNKKVLVNDKYGEIGELIWEIGASYARNEMDRVYHKNESITTHTLSVPSDVSPNITVSDIKPMTEQTPNWTNRMTALREMEDDYRNIDTSELKNSVNVIENLKNISSISQNISQFYKNYLIGVQNIEDALKLASNDIKYYTNLLKVQDYFKKIGLIKEDLTYWHVDDATQDEYQLMTEAAEDIQRADAYKVASYVAEQLNMAKPVRMGEGSWGHAFSSGDKVIKVTTDLSEVKQSLKLKGKSSPRIADIYNVFEVSRPNGEKYNVIILEKLQTNYNEIINKMVRIEDLFKINLEDRPSFTEVVLRHWVNPENFEQVYGIEAFDALDGFPELKQFLKSILKISSELKKLNINSHDFLNPNNLGYKNGKLAFFDLGAGEELEKLTGKLRPEKMKMAEEGGASLYMTTDGLREEEINEVGEGTSQPFPYKNVKLQLDESEYRFFTEKNNLEYRVKLEESEFHYNGLDVSFDIYDDKTGFYHSQTVNEGNPFRVMSTVIKIIEEDIQKRKEKFNQDIENLSFYPIKDDDEIDGNKRERLYLAYLKKLKPEWEYDINPLGYVNIDIVEEGVNEDNDRFERYDRQGVDWGKINDKEGNEYIVLKDRTQDLFRVYDDRKPIGYLYLHFDSDTQKHTPDAGKQDAVFIEPEYRNKGIAQALYKYVIDEKGYDIQPSNVQSPEMKSVWNKIGESLIGGLSKSDYKNVSDEELKRYIQKLDDIIARYNNKEYLTGMDVDDIAYFYYIYYYNGNRISEFINPEKQSNHWNFIVKILKSRGYLNEERIKSWMPNMQTVSVKEKCRLGGKGDGTSEACNQGDIDNLELKPLKDGQSHKPNKPNVAEDDKKYFEKN
ncbi:MAG: GNAT family N-acetyltransferase [bacterium]